MDKPTHFILITDAGVYVKEAEFFKSQGGLKQDWGKNWIPVIALGEDEVGIENARKIGKDLKDRRELNG